MFEFRPERARAMMFRPPSLQRRRTDHLLTRAISRSKFAYDFMNPCPAQRSKVCVSSPIETYLPFLRARKC